MGNDMEISRAEILFQKYFSGEIDPTELQELNSLLENSDHERDFREYIRLNKSIIESNHGDRETLPLHQETESRKKHRSVHYLKYAAIFIGIIGTGLLFTLFNESGSGDVRPERFVSLKLSDSVTKNIESGGSLALQLKDVNIIQNGDSIRYISLKNPSKLVYNEIAVPNGKKIVLQLSDNSFVTLNSGTVFKYPASFVAGQKRQVFLKGEAYFQVKSDSSRAFVVNADGLDISVLGTEFNVNAYGDDGFVKTVLVEGKVRLSPEEANTEHVILRPDMLGIYNKNQKSFTVRKVDPSGYIAWMQDQLVFDKESFSSIARTLERKYDVNLQIEAEGLSKEKFTARVDGDIEEILNYFREIYPFTYTKEGNTFVLEGSK